MYIDLTKYCIVFEGYNQLKSCIVNLDDLFISCDLDMKTIIVNDKYICVFFSLIEIEEFIKDLKIIFKKIYNEDVFDEVLELIEEEKYNLLEESDDLFRE